jgi:hypothetical protein
VHQREKDAVSATITNYGWLETGSLRCGGKFRGKLCGIRCGAEFRRRTLLVCASLPPVCAIRKGVKGAMNAELITNKTPENANCGGFDPGPLTAPGIWSAHDEMTGKDTVVQSVVLILGVPSLVLSV